MIKSTIFICEILFLIIFEIVSIHFIKSSKKSIFLFALCLLVFAFLSHQIMQEIPLLYDEITLTALDQKNDESRGTEVDINHIRVDEHIITSPNVGEGRWYIISNRYSWRPPEDTRWDGSATESIVLRIPVGWERTINFHCNTWRGIVQVSDSTGCRDIIDTYSLEGNILAYIIGRSHTWKLLLNGALQIGIYVVSLLIFNLMFIGVLSPFQKGWRKENVG